MKVLMINVVCGIRSTGRICTDLAEALSKEGHEVKIAYGREHVPEQYQKYAIRIGTDWDVRIHGGRARLFDQSGFGSVKATKRFIEWIREFDPDIIHLHNIHGYYLNVAILFEYLKQSGKRILWTLHDCWAFTGHAAYCEAAACEKWKSGCHDCPNLAEYPASIIDRSRSNWLKKRIIFTGVPNMSLITPSRWLKGLVEGSFLRDYPVRVIYNGIDTGAFFPSSQEEREKTRSELGVKDGRLLLGVAAVWDKRKGLEDLISLGRHTQGKIVIVGVTEKQKQALPREITGITRTNNVEELRRLYAAADVFVNPTYEDNFPTTNIEALACGTPSITYNTGGSPEGAVKTVSKGDWRALESDIAISRQECVERSSAFTRESMWKQYRTLYREIKEEQ